MTEKVNIVFSASSLNTFQNCPCQYKFSTLLNKTAPVEQKAKALDFGGLSHIGFESYFNSLAAGEHFNDCLHSGLMAIRQAASDPMSSNVDIEKELPILIDAVSGSCEFWRHEDETYEILGVEEPFDYILYEDDHLRIIISGKVDLRVNIPERPRSSGYLNLPIDHKTSSREFPIIRLDNQFINYTIPTESNWLLVNKVGLQTTKSPEEKFKRVPLAYDKAFVDNWKANTVNDILHTYLTYMKENVWPMKPGQMRCRMCEFNIVCDVSGDEKDKLWKLETLFVDKGKWDKYKDGE